MDECLLMFIFVSHLLFRAILPDMEIRRGCNVWCESSEGKLLGRGGEDAIWGATCRG